MHDRSVEAQEDTQRVAAGETDPTMQTDGWPYPFTTAKQLLGICAEQGMSIADVVWANECAIHGADAIRAHLDRVWAAMRASVHEGCVSTQRVLPGGLDVPRRAGRLCEIAVEGRRVQPTCLGQPTASGVVGSGMD